MGARNALAALALYAGRVPPTSIIILMYMALRSLDDDPEPWFGQGHAALAEHALGRPRPITESDLRAVRRAVSPLLDAKAITVTRRPATRSDRQDTVRYRLHLDLTPDGFRPTSETSHRSETVLCESGEVGRFPTGRRPVSGRHAGRKPSTQGEREEEEQQPRTRLGPEERLVLDVTDATPAEAFTVVRLIEAEIPPRRSLAGVVRRLAKDGELPDWLNRVRTDTDRRDLGQWLAWARQQAECAHGTPGGDQLRPDNGKPQCPLCRRAAERTL